MDIAIKHRMFVKYVTSTLDDPCSKTRSWKFGRNASATTLTQTRPIPIDQFYRISLILFSLMRISIFCFLNTILFQIKSFSAIISFHIKSYKRIPYEMLLKSAVLCLCILIEDKSLIFHAMVTNIRRTIKKLMKVKNHDFLKYVRTNL